MRVDMFVTRKIEYKGCGDLCNFCLRVGGFVICNSESNYKTVTLVQVDRLVSSRRRNRVEVRHVFK